jgi:hypothetical protein
MKIIFDSNNETIGFYEILKDIIIPFLAVLSTLIIGIIIANLLRKKEEKSKIKGLLIDHYMEYLEARNLNIDFEIAFSTYEILNNILINHDSYLQKNTNSYISFNIISSKAEEYKLQAQQYHNKGSHWSLFTYRFAFLLGKKEYLKEAQPLEDNIVRNLLQENSRQTFNDTILTQIKSSEEILKGLNSNKTFTIELAIHTIELLIAKKFNDNQFTFFNPYNNKIADLINEY